MRSAILLGVVVLLSRPAPGQTPPGVAEILKKISETYRGVSQYELVAEAVKLPGTNAPPRAHTRIAFKAPNRYRMEATIPRLMETAIPGVVEDGAKFDETVVVYDGLPSGCTCRRRISTFLFPPIS